MPNDLPSIVGKSIGILSKLSNTTIGSVFQIEDQLTIKISGYSYDFKVGTEKDWPFEEGGVVKGEIMRVYLTNKPLNRRGVKIPGLSQDGKCVISLPYSYDKNKKIQPEKILDLLLHHFGQSLGVKPENGAVSYMGIFHCMNRCVMSTEIFEENWGEKANKRYNNKNHPLFCPDCKKQLISAIKERS